MTAHKIQCSSPNKLRRIFKTDNQSIDNESTVVGKIVGGGVGGCILLDGFDALAYNYW
jgi:hypothetical protein